MSENIVWPKKTRDIHNHHMDSTAWEKLKFRDDDIVIATWAKSGTTWTQQIVAQLIFDGDPSIQTEAITPWLELRVMPEDVKFDLVESQNHRRFIKTHLPVDALVFSPKAKYIYVARDFPDIIWSMYHHLNSATDEFYEMLNDTPGRIGPPIERPTEGVYAFWKHMLHNDVYPFWSFWENIRTWWEIRNLPNVKLVHFNDLKKDLSGEMHSIAEFLEISVNESHWDTIVEHCTFDWMKQHAEQVSPMGGAMWEGGASAFINKGTNKRWKDTLSETDIEEYKQIAEKQLGADCLEWLINGTV